MPQRNVPVAQLPLPGSRQVKQVRIDLYPRVRNRADMGVGT